MSKRWVPLRAGGPTWARGALLAVASGCLTSALGSWSGLAQGDVKLLSLAPGAEQFWVLVAAGAVCALAWAVLALSMWHRRRSRGALLIVHETSTDWERTIEDLDEFTASVSGHFVGVRRVPGPALLHRWGWPSRAGAEHWDERTYELLDAVRIVQRTDRNTRRMSLAIWAWWSVALALTARLARAEPGLDLRICPRPSQTGNQGQRLQIDPRRTCSFAPNPGIPPLGDLTRYAQSWRHPWRRLTRRRRVTATEHEHTATLAVTATPTPARGTASPPGTGVQVLVARTTAGPWGPLPSLNTPTASTGPASRHLGTLTVEDYLGTGCIGDVPCTVREWPCALPHGVFFEADEAVVVAQALVAWISTTYIGAPDDTYFLGATLAPEVAAGVGILARALDASHWPEHLYPLQYVRDGNLFTVPDLDLGLAALNRVQRPKTP